MKTKNLSIRLIAGVFALSVLTFSSCKKDKDEEVATPTPTPPTKTELLTGKNWKETALTVNPAIEVSPGVFVTDYYAQLQPCGVDDITLFKTNGTYLADAKVLCGTEPATTTGTWTFNTDQTKITLDAGTANSQDMTILQLDASTLKGTINVDLGTGVIYTFTVTYTKQ